MGYDASFKIIGEIDPKYKSWRKDTCHEDIVKYKNLLIAACMASSNENSDNLSATYDKILMSLKIYINYLSEDWKVNLAKGFENQKEEDKVYSVCGWKYSKNGSGADWTIESLEDFMIEELFQMAMQPSGSPFDDTENKYYDKLSKIKDTVSEIEDIVWDIWEMDFYNDYKDKEGSDFEESY